MEIGNNYYGLDINNKYISLFVFPFGLEIQLKDNKVELTHGLREPINNKFHTIANEADAAMKRFTAKLKKETNNNAKSKQAKRKSV